jgi:hypothetical protein
LFLRPISGGRRGVLDGDILQPTHFCPVTLGQAAIAASMVLSPGRAVGTRLA